MGQFILAVILLLALAENADSAEQTARHQNGDIATITDEPCALGVVMIRIPPDMREQFRQGSAVVGGVSYPFCWRDLGPQIHLIYEDMDQGLIPWAEFDKPNKRGT